ncbi:helix-turn-helix domain-containing protein [Actinomadura terrae]|uniref:helix-turn-helix domain-containing protein n=1 Tax=Actinomadura terrae TaxID=604353 RepID=UPI001FA76F67|nr:helix-turn-helix transcriptional regulator [Actinomadura terrae]
MTTVPSSSARQAREALGARLRELRKDAGFSGRELASRGFHYSKVSRLETGSQAPSDADIRAWCNACGVEEEAPDLVATARAVESAYLEFRRQTRAGMKRLMAAHVPLYERTEHFRIYEHNAIPGLFQTADYAASMLSFWIDFLDSPNDLEQALAIRMERQKVIYQSSKRVAVLLEEQALCTWFGTAEVQIGQLDRLLADMGLPNVSIGIIPMMRERKAVGSAGFWIFDDSLVCLETPTASIEVTRPQEVAQYVRMFDVLREAAVYGPDAQALIRKALAAF